MEELAHELAAEVARSYRIEVETAHRIIVDLWRRDAALQELAAAEPDARRLKRTRAYKRAASAAKASVYQGLRTYRRDADGLDEGLQRLQGLAAAGASAADPRAEAARELALRAHVSTAERIGEAAAFFDAVFELAGEPRSVLDLGCGVQPLMYPFHGRGRSTRRYVALDRDATAVEVVRAWARLLGGGVLEARRWSLSEGFAGLAGPGSGGRFELALALKLVPVLQRQERARLELLREVPARRLLATGSREAMVKRRSIRHREERSLRSFAERAGLPVLGVLETGSEIGLLLDLA